MGGAGDVVVDLCIATIQSLTQTQTKSQPDVLDLAKEHVDNLPDPTPDTVVDFPFFPTPMLPTPTPTSQPTYDLALGLSNHLLSFTAEIQEQTNRTTYHVWSIDLPWERIGKNPETGRDLLLNSGMSRTAYKANFGILLSNFFQDSPNGLVRFNIQDMKEGGIEGPSATQWELEYILENYIALQRTKFYDYKNNKYVEVTAKEAATRVP